MESITDLEKLMLKKTATSRYRKELDLALHLVARTGFITKAGIRYITEERGESGNYRFIDAMNRSGWFQLWDMDSPAWTLSHQGWLEANALGVSPVEPPCEHSFFHHATVMNLALEFQRRGFVEAWAMHSQLIKEGGDRVVIQRGSNRRRYSDVLMRTRFPRSTQIAVELELGRNSRQWYKQLLRGYVGAPGISLLLVVYLDDRLPVLIEKLARQLGFPTDTLPIMFVDLRDLFHDHESGPAHNQPDNDGFGRVIGQIRSAIDKSDSISNLNLSRGGNYRIRKQAS